jgi:hypothetical protein
MSVLTAFSPELSPVAAVQSIAKQFSSGKPKCVIYFASSSYPTQEISSAMHGAFPNSIVFGCTTSGEIGSGKMLKNSIVAMALDGDTIEDLALEVVENISSGNGVSEAIETLAAHFERKPLELDPSEFVGVVLFDGLSGVEEIVNDKIGNYTNVLFVGGSAGDDLNFVQTSLFANGKPFSDAAIFALIKPGVPFDIIKTQSFKPTGKQFLVSEAIEPQRTIVKLDNRPALEVYSEAVNQTPEDAQGVFMKYPFGLMAAGEPFVRSPQQVQDNKIVFYCSVKEGMTLELLEAQDMIEDTRTAIEKKELEMGGISAILVFNCILRTLQLENEGKSDSYGSIFEKYPAIGFSTYGESFIGHINQTATMLVLGK